MSIIIKGVSLDCILMEAKYSAVRIRWVKYKPSSWAKIVGVTYSNPRGLTKRLCFVVKYENGEEDLIPTDNEYLYELEYKNV